MITSGADWKVEAGEITEEERQHQLDFHMRSGGKLPKIATARQRHVGAEIDQHYRKADGSLAQGLFRGSMNILMQMGTPRLEAEEKVVTWIREDYADFTPLRR